MTDEVCKQLAGKFMPVVDFNSLRGKGASRRGVPYDVFEVRKIEWSDYANLEFLSKFKNRVGGI